VLTKIFKRITPPSLEGQFMKRLMRMNTKHTKRPTLDPVLRKRLQVEFQPEVQKLADLLGRDLRSWSSS